MLSCYADKRLVKQEANEISNEEVVSRRDYLEESWRTSLVTLSHTLLRAGMGSMVSKGCQDEHV